MEFSRPVHEVIRRRYSCRAYQKTPLSGDVQNRLRAVLAGLTEGPLGSRGRFSLMASTAEDEQALKGVGTYGFIRNPAGYLVGAMEQGETALEDFGYLMEKAVLQVTDLGLGSCWVGGIFSKSSFAKKLALTPSEVMPAVVPIGSIADARSPEARVQAREESNLRLPSSSLFFDGNFSCPLEPKDAGPHRAVLEMVRWAPSANNKQPWRVVRAGSSWHFYRVRTPGYGKGTLIFKLFRIADLQRVDIGIAMCHFDLGVREAGLGGSWCRDGVQAAVTMENAEYVATWQG